MSLLAILLWDITYKDKFDIVFKRFLLNAYANYDLEALLIFIISSAYMIFCLNTYTILPNSKLIDDYMNELF